MITVVVKTADGTPIPGASVSVAGSSAAATNTQGSATFASARPPAAINVIATDYIAQTVNITAGLGGALLWDDPGTVVSGSATTVTVTVPLGRMAPAPTVATTNTELTNQTLTVPADIASRITSGRQDPTSYVVPIQTTFTLGGGQYAFVFAGLQQFYAVNALGMLGDPTGKGWAVLASGSSKIQPDHAGSFTWVEWGPTPGTHSPRNRYLVALWRPRSAVVSGTRPSDVIVFYSPTTTTPPYPSDRAPYVGNYPYALNGEIQNEKGVLKAVLDQRYIKLGLRMLFYERYLAYQLLAAGKDALLVIPIQPAANWEHFARLGGVQRLITEAILFDHRQRRGQPDAGQQAPDVAPVLSVAGGYAPHAPPAIHLAPPHLGTVALGGFSAGVAPVKQLAGASLQIGQPSPARSWNDESTDPYLATPTQLVASWRELWDVDAPGAVTGGAGTWARFLRTWQTTGKRADRVARCYHSSQTGWQASDTDALAPVTGSPTVNRNVPRSGPPVAAERHGNSGSVVWFSNTYLSANGPPKGWVTGTDSPAIWTYGPHEVMPAICFAHAAGMSQLQGH